MMLDRPNILFLFLLLLALAWAWRVAYLRDRRTLKLLGGKWRLSVLLDVYVFKSFFSFLFFSVFFSAAVLALAGFRWGERLVEERRSGQELIVALDVSNSMLAVDDKRSRLDFSVSAIRRIAEALEGVRIGLVVFKGQAEQLLPLTEDRYALETALRYAGPSVMTSPGTGLEEGIEKSMEAFSGLSHFYRAIILFSDGEVHSGNPAAAAAEAGKAGIPLYVVAVGSDQGASVTLPGGGQLKDGEGRPVITRVDLDTLEKIADASGGEVFRLGDREEKVVEQILGAMKGRREGNMVLGMRQEKKDRYRFLLVLAIVFLSLSLAVKAVRWKNIL